ncbi:MAG: hypothetical protein CVV44_09840 [Spirochaetae bacterium HGW-Spirochaetae-1]|jgi:hypothetical protein|nr:MAG: hypothetical protein CVV44_09840 [Spirochaetae bacterium HGW-Spirochaetae-1]
METLMKKFLPAFLLILFPFTVLAKDRVAILDFQTYNCPQSVARVVGQMTNSRIFETKVFTLVEREEMEAILREMSLQQTGCTDSSCAVQMGKLLSANKILTGTVLKMDTFNIAVKVINVENGKVEGSYRSEAMNAADFEPAVLSIVEKVRYDFRNELYLSIAASAGYRKALGDYSGIADNGYGGSIHAGLHNFLFKGGVLSMGTGFFTFEGADGAIDSILAIPVTAGFGYSLNISRNIHIIPIFGTGIHANLMNHDPDNADQYGNYEYTREVFIDPVIFLQCDVEMTITPFVQLFLSPSYTIMFEKGKTGQIPGLDGGIRLTF